jgi:hypothetical protein
MIGIPQISVRWTVKVTFQCPSNHPSSEVMKQRETTQQFLWIWFRLLLSFLARTVRHEKEKEKQQSFSTFLNGKKMWVHELNFNRK